MYCFLLTKLWLKQKIISLFLYLMLPVTLLFEMHTLYVEEMF